MALDQPIVVFGTILLLLQFAVVVYMAISLRIAGREREVIHREIFGLVRRMEGLTSHRREQIIKHYDKMLDTLSCRLPTAVASQASQVIFDAESRILQRLAELEPELRNDEIGRRKMDDLIKSMENLEHTLVSITSDTVRKVMVEGRAKLLEGEFSGGGESLAA